MNFQEIKYHNEMVRLKKSENRFAKISFAQRVFEVFARPLISAKEPSPRNGGE